MLTQIENDSVTDDTLICHTDPFYAECRAYGRIEEEKRQKKLRRDIAVPCYGFLGIAPEQEKMLMEQFGVRLWDGTEDEDFRKQAQGQPIRALMKELIEEETSLTDQTLKRMLRDLRALRRIGIYPRDIAARNYRGGRLVDFGASCTEPYVLFQICPKWQVDFWKTEDLAMFDEMIEDESIETEVRATPNHEYCKKLRPRKQTTDEE
jgi:Kinetochore Sim4 complex subunit FTA2